MGKDDNFWILEITASIEDANLFTTALENSGMLGYYEVLWEKENPAFKLTENTTNMEYFFAGDIPIEEVNARISVLEMIATEPDKINYSLSKLSYTDIENAYRKHFQPIMLKGVCIYPPWEAKPAFVPYGGDFGEPTVHSLIKPGCTIPLIIQPAMAFGTGGHDTTQLFLGYILEHFSNPSQKLSIIDMGTGSGVLALLAALLGHRVRGIDVAPLAVQNANQNTLLNRKYYRKCMSLRELEFAEGDFEHEWLNESYDLFFGNLTASIIEQNFEKIAALNINEGIFSGILEKFSPTVMDLMKKNGMKVVKKLVKNDWNLIHWEK